MDRLPPGEAEASGGTGGGGRKQPRIAERGARRLAALATALVAMALLVADFEITAGKVERLHPTPCKGPAPAGCTPEQLADSEEYDRLSAGLATRSWVYAGGLIAIVVVLTLLAERSLPAASRGEAFTDLGIGGVGWLLAALLVFGFAPEEVTFELPGGQLMAPSFAMVGVAALGAGLARASNALRRSPAAAETKRTPLHRLPAVAWVALGLAGLALAVASIGSTEPGCGTDVPAWRGTVETAALVIALAGAACGLGALARRRWIVALVTIVLTPAFVVAALIGGCLE